MDIRQNVIKDENEINKVIRGLFNDDNVDDNHFIAEKKEIIKPALLAKHLPLYVLMEEQYLDEETIKEIVKVNPEAKIYVTNHQHYEDEIFKMLKENGYYRTGLLHIRDLGIRCYFARKKEDSLDEVLSKSKKILIVDNVVKRINLGCLCSSAYVLGADAIVFTLDCRNPFNRKIINYSNGDIFRINYCYINSLNDETIAKFKEYGFTTIALALRKETLDIKDPLLKSFEKIAIAVGNEYCGLAEEVLDALDYTVKIPMYNNADSLNVAAAATVVLWEISKETIYGK